MALNQEFYRSSYRNVINTIEQRNPNDGYKTRMMGDDGKPMSKYVVNREERGFKKIKVTRSYLRSEILLQPTLSSYNFPILSNVSANNGPTVPGTQPTEQRLKLQDVFFCNRMGFYYYCAITNGGNTEFRYILYTGPTVNFIQTGVDPVQMYAIWTTGQLQVTVNNDVLTPAWDMLQHLYIPQLQGDPSGGATNFTAPGETAILSYLNGFTGDRDSLIIVEPNWVLNGGNDNEYVITFPQSLNTMGISSTIARFFMVLKLEGFLAQNCSSVMDNK